MPLNLGNRHWVALYIHFYTKDRSRPAVGYFDPLGDDMPQELKQILKQVYLRLTSSHILACPIRLQSDGYNCGSWVIAILESLIAKRKFKHSRS